MEDIVTVGDIVGNVCNYGGVDLSHVQEVTFVLLQILGTQILQH